MSSVTFAIYNEARTKISLTMTILGYDQDTYFTPQVKTFVINPKDYVNGGIWRARIQPQNQRCLGLSVKFESSSAIRVYDLQYHWAPEAQAIMQGGRTS